MLCHRHYQIRRGTTHIKKRRGATIVKIIARGNGPYLVEVDGQVKATLCRCGHSFNKPFCDGAHKKVGFQAPFYVIELWRYLSLLTRILR
jgi:CDGSH-type Zn-finger protein